MDTTALRASLAAATPPAGLAPALAALWWDGRGEWERAHAIVMGESEPDAAWVHGYLHRKEGDLANARYWYGEAGRTMPEGPPDTEWEAIAATLLAR